MLSPVAIFVYNRADQTAKTLAALRENTLASDTDVYVFSDGGKDASSWRKVNEVRLLLAETKKHADSNQSFHSFNIIERPENLYLERNIIEGIRFVLERHDTIIVLEDDIVTSPFFLQYMNDAFRVYRDDPKVMHVSGFTNLDLPQTEFPPIYFTPHMSGWGWGTWRNRWNTYFVHFQSEAEALEGLTDADKDEMQYGGVFPCLKSLKKQPIPWDICWEIAIYKTQGLCLTPHHTLVRNIGLKQGTHFSSHAFLQRFEFDRPPSPSAIVVDYRNPEKEERIEALFREAIKDWGIRYTWIGKSLRFVYKKFKRKNG